ncbi:MAG: hypothetical protein AB1540_10185 [Bdellovibrionota bacterium]
MAGRFEGVMKSCRWPVLLVVWSLFFPALGFSYSDSQFQSVTTEEEAQVNRIRDQEISQLKIVLGRRFAESRRPDILLRLAELYTEKYRFYFLKENEIYQKLHKQGQRPKTVDHTRSRAQLKSSTNVCLSVLNSKVPFKKLDQVYYYLGYNAQESGNERAALNYLGILVRKYPNSIFAAEAYRSLGDYAFEDQKYGQAVSLFEKAARYTNVPSHPRTLYKLAWSYYRVKRKTDALNTMKRVISLSTAANEKFVGLREESLNDVVLFFSEAGRYDDAKSYFSEIKGGAEIYVTALGKLSTLYAKRGEYKLAIGVNNALLEEYGEKRPELVHQMHRQNVELYRKLGDGKGEENALRRLVQYFSDHSSEVSSSSKETNPLLETKGYLRGRATEVHKDAQKKGVGRERAVDMYSRAADLYGLYIKAFLERPRDDKDRKELSEIRIYRSDALLAAKREPEAMTELELALQADGDSKHRREAGATLLNILIKKIDADKSKNKNFTENEKKFVNLSEAFEDIFPKDKLVAELRYKRARLVAAKSGPEGLSKEARSALSEMVEKYPARAEAIEAAQELIADAVKRKDPENAADLARSYLENNSLLSNDRKGEFRQYLRSVLARESFAAVQEVEKDEEYEKAGRDYERLAATPGIDSDVSYRALNNAVVNFEKAGKLDDAERVLLSMHQKFPKKSDPRERLKGLASRNLWGSRFAEAAKLYSKLSSFDGYTRDERLSFVRTSFWLSASIGDPASAYLTAHRGLNELCAPMKHADDRCHELSIETGRLLTEANRLQEGVSHLRAYLAKSLPRQRRAEAAFILAETYRDLHENRKYSQYLEEAAASIGKGSSKRKKQEAADSLQERNFAARAAFLLVEPHFRRFNQIRLGFPESALKAQTREKLSLLESLVTRYSQVVGYGDGEWGIAALERLHDAFSSFSRELEAAPVPAKLEAAAREQYVRGIRQVSAPMAMRATEFLKQAYQKGTQLEVTTPTFIALTQRLSRQSPREFPPAHYTLYGEDLHGVGKSALKLSGTVVAGKADELKSSGHSWRKQVFDKLSQNPKSPQAWVEFGNLEALSARPRLARLLYEQALSINSKYAPAQANLAVILALEKHNIQANQGFTRAAVLDEFDKEIRFNLAKSLLAFHHFKPAFEHLRSLSARFADDKEITEALAVAALGLGQLASAGSKLEELDAKGSKRFTLWYNWSVWAVLSGESNQRQRAIEQLKDRRESLSPLERNQVDVVLSAFSEAKVK